MERVFPPGRLPKLRRMVLIGFPDQVQFLLMALVLDLHGPLVGQHLLGHHAGDKVEFPVPDGIAKYQVVEVKK